MKKKLLLSTLLIAGLTTLSAANQQGINFYEVGDYVKAKSLFLSSSQDATDSYYLGEIYFKENKKDSAQYYYNKGLQMDPENVMNTIGINKVQLATSPTANDALNKLSKDRKYKKSASVLTAIASAYADNKKYEEAKDFIEKAIKADKKFPPSYLLQGDILLAQGNSGEAAASYENAIYFDPNYKASYIKLAKLYENIKTQVAMDYLRKVVATDPTYAPGFAALGEIAYRKGFYPEALTAYESYMKLVTPTPVEQAQYAEILFFNEKYTETLNTIGKAKTSFVTERLKMYSQFQLGDFAAALVTAEKFFSSTDKKDIISQDYTYYAQILTNQKNFAKAGEIYAAAFDVDTTKNVSNLRKAASSYEKAQEYANAAKYYEKVFEFEPEYSLADLYSVGTTYYTAGTQTDALEATPEADKTKKQALLKKADEYFKIMTEKFPDHYLGYLMRARTNFALDPTAEEGLAKPYYEKSIEVMMPNKEERKNDILESYRYLGFYYLGQDKAELAKSYWNKVLEIDPTDETALQVINALK